MTDFSLNQTESMKPSFSPPNYRHSTVTLFFLLPTLLLLRRRERFVDASDWQSVSREVQNLHLVRHPHVIQLYDVRREKKEERGGLERGRRRKKDRRGNGKEGK